MDAYSLFRTFHSQVLIITMVLSLSACGKTLKGTDGLIEKAREEIPISDSDTIDLQYAGMCGNDNRAIAWFISGNEYQKNYYLPMEVEVKEDAAELTVSISMRLSTEKKLSTSSILQSTLTASPISNASSSSMQCAYWSRGMGNGMVATPYSG